MNIRLSALGFLALFALIFAFTAPALANTQGFDVLPTGHKQKDFYFQLLL